MDEQTNDIVKAVLKLYSKYGIKSVTMDDAAHELGISKKTLYSHFKDKNELVEKVIDYQCAKRQEWMSDNKIENLSALEAIIVVNRMIHNMLKEFNPSFNYDLAKYYQPIYKKFMAFNRDTMAKSMLLNLQKGKREGVYRAELNEEIIVRMHITNTENMAKVDFYNQAGFAQEEIHREIFSYHMHAILSPKGLEKYNQLLEQETQTNHPF